MCFLSLLRRKVSQNDKPLEDKGGTNSINHSEVKPKVKGFRVKLPQKRSKKNSPAEGAKAGTCVHIEEVVPDAFQDEEEAYVNWGRK